MTGKLNSAQNSTVTNLQKYAYTCSDNTSVSRTSRVKPNLTVYDKLRQNNGLSDYQLPVGGKL